MLDWINFDSTDGSDDVLAFQATTSSYSYNAPIVSTYFRAYHEEDDDPANSAYYTSGDQSASDAAYQWLGTYQDQDVANASGCGNLTLFGHSNTTDYKNFLSRGITDTGSAAHDAHVAGYFDTTEAITALQFKALGGGAFTGTNKLYGLATS